MPKSLLGTYFQFLRSPDLNAPPIPLQNQTAIRPILGLYSVHLLLLLIVLAVIGQVPNAGDSNNMLDAIADMPVWYLPVMAVLVAPLQEECIFRLPLRPFAASLALSISLIVLIAFSWFAVLPSPLLLVLATALASLNLYLWARGSKVARLQPIYNHYPRVIFYGIALLFGAVHITNYDTQVWPFLPILVMPQIIVGLLLGFVRLRYGFGWSFLLHAFHNGCLLLPVVLVQLFGSKQLQTLITESAGLENLSLTDEVIMSAVSLYMLGGLLLCGVIAWRVIREWTTRKAQS